MDEQAVTVRDDLVALFPGQGSIGARAGVAWRHSAHWSVVDRVSEVAGVDVERLLLEADDTEVVRTDNAQLATFALSLVGYGELLDAGRRPRYFLGHSLGEFSALVAAGVVSLEDGARLIAVRGAAMARAAALAEGSMVAVMGGDDAARHQLSTLDGVWVANINGTGQIVLSGTREGLDDLLARHRELGWKRATPLPVGGALPLSPHGAGPGRARRGPRPGHLAQLGRRGDLQRGRSGARLPRRVARTHAPTAHLARGVPGGHVDAARDGARQRRTAPGRGAERADQAHSGLRRPVRARHTRRRPGGQPVNRHVLVTGASRGIGAAVARHFIDLGDTVTTLSRSNAAPAGAAKSYEVDVADADQVNEAIKQAIGEFGPLEVAVVNAGVTRDGLALRMTDEQWREVLSVNLDGAFYTARAALASMVRARRGSIIFMGSISPFMGVPGQANYAAAKAGLVGLARALAREVASRSITVNVVAPGLIDTDMTSDLGAARESMLAMIPIGRAGDPDEVAGVVGFLASNHARYITGAVIPVDGGLALGL